MTARSRRDTLSKPPRTQAEPSEARALTLSGEEVQTPTRATLLADIHAARQGDAAALERLTTHLDNTVQGAELHSMLAKVTLSAEESFLKLMYGKEDLLFPELQRRQLAQQRQELGRESASALERMLIDRVVLCKLQLDFFDSLLSRSAENISLKQYEFYLKRIDGAHRRHLAAVKALAQVRRLQLPSVEVHGGQINIGEKQINVVQGATQANLAPIVPEG